MTDNASYIYDDEPVKALGSEVANIIIENDSTQTEFSPACCSWSRTCDVLGNRQGRFIEALRPLRAYLIKAQQCLRTFQIELERGIKTKRSASKTALSVQRALLEINKLTTHLDLNIAPEEAQMLRQVSYDMAVLWRVIDEVALTTPDFGRRPSGRHLQDIGVVRVDESGTQIRDMATDNNGSVDEVMPRLIPTSSPHSLKERITRTCDAMEKVIKFIDTKTQRRWWLRDVINFAQLFIKLALFVSAAISVVYHKEQIAPIITLTITIIQGVVEMLDQYFLKHTKPTEVRLSVASTISATDYKA